MSSTTILFIRRPFLLLVLLVWALTVTQCGGTATPPEIIPDNSGHNVIVSLKSESETRLIGTEDIPLNNCGGNSALTVDVERSREFVYAITDENGVSLGGQYFFLQGLLEKQYNVIDGETEAQTYTIHLETKANSRVVYTIAWKETRIKGEANISSSEKHEDVPYRVRKALTFEVEGVKEIACE